MLWYNWKNLKEGQSSSSKMNGREREREREKGYRASVVQVMGAMKGSRFKTRLWTSASSCSGFEFMSN
jgi:hypothetical protein